MQSLVLPAGKHIAVLQLDRGKLFRVFDENAADGLAQTEADADLHPSRARSGLPESWLRAKGFCRRRSMPRCGDRARRAGRRIPPPAGEPGGSGEAP